MAAEPCRVTRASGFGQASPTHDAPKRLGRTNKRLQWHSPLAHELLKLTLVARCVHQYQGFRLAVQPWWLDASLDPEYRWLKPRSLPPVGSFGLSPRHVPVNGPLSGELSSSLTSDVQVYSRWLV